MHTLAKIDAHSLSEKQRLFADAMAKGIPRQEACKIAGYHDWEREGTRLMSLPHVRAFIQQQRESLFCGDLASIATNTIRELMTDEGTPAHVRFQAAKLTLAIAGHVEKTGKTANSNAVKEIHEMSPGELDAFIAEGRRQVVTLEAEVRNVDASRDEAVERADDAQE